MFEAPLPMHPTTARGALGEYVGQPTNFNEAKGKFLALAPSITDETVMRYALAWVLYYAEGEILADLSDFEGDEEEETEDAPADEPEAATASGPNDGVLAAEEVSVVVEEETPAPAPVIDNQMIFVEDNDEQSDQSDDESGDSEGEADGEDNGEG